MFKSLRSWATIPIRLYPFHEEDAMGDSKFYDPIDAVCYAEGGLKLITDRMGKEVVSSTTLYIDAEAYSISPYDEIVFEGTRHKIKLRTSYYDAGRLSLWVVYL